MYLLLLAFVGLGHLANRNWKVFCALIGLISTALTGFFLAHFDTFLQSWQIGSNPAAVHRDLWWMVKFGMFIPDILLPKDQRNTDFSYFGGENYHWKIPSQLEGESQTAYIGLVAVIFLIALVIWSLVRASSKTGKPILPLFWFVVIIFTFAVAGGVNYLMGSLGFQLLRASNRYSISLATVALLFGSMVS